MREKKYHIYLTDDEQSRVIQSLINLKNNLQVQIIPADKRRTESGD